MITMTSINYIPRLLVIFFAVCCNSFIPLYLVAAQDSTPRLAQRYPFDNAYYVTKGDWVCSKNQLRMIKSAIADTKRIASHVIKVLQVPGAETSEAYRTWFGSSNANVARKDKILEHHYRIALENLREPSMPVTFDVSDSPRYQVAGHAPPVADHSIVYACPEKLHAIFLCQDTAAAVILEMGGKKPGMQDATVIYFCPDFFTSRLVSETEMKKEWKQGSDAKLSRGMVLVHELQHMAVATTASEYCGDLAYTSERCKTLSDDKKIKNAQNYAYFALDVLVNPAKGAPGTTARPSQ
ncbi:hypothetical protein LY76DRAFT_630453 [Colletotrichum caudatum]|nr:hypothetical protein LY76DRAFT_630453 [Colletotrichum caudatum]